MVFRIVTGDCKTDMTVFACNEMNIIMNARRNRRTNSSLVRKTASILGHVTSTGRISVVARNGARFVATL